MACIPAIREIVRVSPLTHSKLLPVTAAGRYDDRATSEVCTLLLDFHDVLRVCSPHHDTLNGIAEGV